MGMIRWLNRHRWGFALLWAVPALLLAVVSRTWRVGAVLLIWIPLAIAVAWLYFTSLEKEIAQAREALERCDPEPLLRTSRELTEGFPLERPRTRSVGISLGLSESAALFSMGRETEAVRLLDRLEPWVQTSGGPNRATWLLNRATGALREENGPQARRFLEEAERTVEAMAPEVRKASAWEAALERYRWQLRFLEKEDPAQLLEEVRSRLERPESLRLQVMDHYHAACCLRALGRTEEACPPSGICRGVRRRFGGPASGRGPAEGTSKAGDAVRAAVFRGIGKVRALRA